MISAYVERDSLIHRAPAGLKLGFLAIAGAGLFFLADWRVLAAALTGAFGLVACARIPVRIFWSQLRPLLLFVAVLVAFQLVFAAASAAAIVGLRLLTLLVLAILVTLTTRPSQMVEAIERALSPFDRWIAVEKVSLAISLALRFIPVVAQMATATREAQWARGQERSMIALATPLIIQTLKTADQIAEALDARGFASEERREPEPPTSSDGS